MSMESKSKLPYTPVTLQDKVAQMYYRHGVFCASHPYIIMVITLVILAFCCYPVLYLPLLGSSSQQFSTPVQNHILQSSNSNLDSIHERAPWWFQGPPVGFVQQIVVKSVVLPWKSGLILTDAFRGPLAESFNILETIRNHRTIGDNATALADICFQISEPIDKNCQALPQYGCLILSPAHIWSQDINRFQQDPDIIKTIFRFRDVIPDNCNLRDVLFGVPWKETGIKKLNMRTRPRILTYAITIVMKELDLEFVHSLHKKLQDKYNFMPYPENITYNPKDSTIAHVQFQDQYTVAEFVPLGVTYVILFLYIYFSVRKIEMVKSKWALAVSAVITLLMSLFMSVGLCLWFGLHPTLNGSEILPYLVVVIGLENMLVLTKSVVSTPDHLDTKLRLAQGLSKEGWSITKNLFTELALLTLAFFTFVPAIQEFCLFAVVGLLSDFFLQLVFFITALSIGIGRTELTDSYRDSVQHQIKLMNARYQQPKNSRCINCKTDNSNSFLHRTKFGSTHLKSPFVLSQKSYSAVNGPEANHILRKVPKRLKFMDFWAGRRLVQRGIMVCVVFWIVVLLYTSGIVSHIADNTTRLGPTIAEQVVQPLFFTLTGGSSKLKSDNGEEEDKDNSGDWQTSTVKYHLQHHNLNSWKALPSRHWAKLFGYYNISLSGSYISILPTIHLCIPIDPDMALKLRHPADANFEVAKETKDVPEFDDSSVIDIPYHPASPAEVFLAFALSIPSLIFFIYLMVLLYRCMCSRNYAEWRSSWHQNMGTNAKEEYSHAESDHYFVSETFPVKLQGHIYEVENFVADENVVVSTCLAGDICIWDALSGECLKIIKRSRRSLNKIENLSAVNNGESNLVSGDNSSTSVQHEEDHCNTDTSYLSRDRDFSFSLPTHLKLKNCQGYDFSKFCSCTQSRQKQNPEDKENGIGKTLTLKCDNRPKHLHHQSSYNGSSPEVDKKDASVQYSPLPYQSIWSMDCSGNKLVLGCAEGRIEIWDTTAGILKCTYEDNDSGVTSVCLSENRITAARLNGSLEFFLLNCVEHCTEDTSKRRRDATEHIDSSDNPHWECLWLHIVHAHSQPISRLVTGGGHVITGSQDHLVKVFRSESPVCLYTLHGHSGGVTALHIDQSTSSSSAASGCQDGMICVWDLMTGTCVYSLRAHRGAVMALLTSSMYVISYGADDFMCIWEKCQGHHLHTIHQPHSICNDVALLTNNIIVSAKEDHLTLWDVNHGETLQMISLGFNEQGAFVKGLKLAGQALVCDYGSQLFIIHFPAIREKGE